MRGRRPCFVWSSNVCNLLTFIFFHSSDVLFNDTLEYNIAYGGINNPTFQTLMNNPDNKYEFK